MGIDAGKPILDFISGLMGFTSFFENFVQIVILLIAWLIVIISFFVMAIQLFVSLIEFKLTTLAGFVLVPFGLFGRTAFLAEKVLGNVVSSGVKILVLAVIIGIGQQIFGQFTSGFNNPPTISDALTLIWRAYRCLACRSSVLALRTASSQAAHSLAPVLRSARDSQPQVLARPVPSQPEAHCAPRAADCECCSCRRECRRRGDRCLSRGRHCRCGASRRVRCQESFAQSRIKLERKLYSGRPGRHATPRAWRRTFERYVRWGSATSMGPAHAPQSGNRPRRVSGEQHSALRRPAEHKPRRRSIRRRMKCSADQPCATARRRLLKHLTRKQRKSGTSASARPAFRLRTGDWCFSLHC